MRAWSLALATAALACGEVEPEPPLARADVAPFRALDAGPSATPSSLPIPARPAGPLSVLIVGNSHVFGLEAALIEIAATVEVELRAETLSRGNAFLSDHWNNPNGRSRLDRGPWTHVVLQGQKYSQSGLREYPTDAAEAWIEAAKARGIVPVLFPEHPQRGLPYEARRVHNLHRTIAARAPACVAPVGLTWDAVISAGAGLGLHQADGNHATPQGTRLSAVVLAAVLTGTSADDFGDIAGGVTAEESTESYVEVDIGNGQVQAKVRRTPEEIYENRLEGLEDAVKEMLVRLDFLSLSHGSNTEDVVEIAGRISDLEDKLDSLRKVKRKGLFSGCKAKKKLDP